MLQVCLLLCSAKPLSLFGLILAALIAIVLKLSLLVRRAPLCDSLRFRFLICRGFSISFSFLFGRNLRFLAFNLRIFCRVP
jgi:hypothetical protein